VMIQNVTLEEIDSMEEALGDMSNDSCVRQCMELMKRYEFDSARYLLERALREEPDNVEASRCLIDVLSIRGLYGDVIRQFYELVTILDSAGRTDEAIVESRRALSFKTDDDMQRKKLILMLKKKGDMKGFVRESLTLAELYSETGHDNLAVSLLDTLSRIRPEDDDITLFRANLLLKQGNISESVELYREMALKYMSRGEKEKALKAFRRVVMLDSRDFRTLMMLGILYQEMERFEEAEASFRNALRLDLNSEEALFALGNVCIMQGEYRDSILAYSKVVRQNPGHMKAKEKLAWLYAVRDEYDSALMLYEEVRAHYESVANAGEELNILREMSRLREETEAHRARRMELERSVAAASGHGK